MKIKFLGVTFLTRNLVLCAFLVGGQFFLLLILRIVAFHFRLLMTLRQVLAIHWFQDALGTSLRTTTS